MLKWEECCNHYLFSSLLSLSGLTLHPFAEVSSDNVLSLSYTLSLTLAYTQVYTMQISTHLWRASHAHTSDPFKYTTFKDLTHNRCLVMVQSQACLYHLREYRHYILYTVVLKDDNIELLNHWYIYVH